MTIFIYTLAILLFVILYYSHQIQLTKLINNLTNYELQQQHILLFLQNPVVRATIFLLCLLVVDTNPFIALFAFVGTVSSMHLSHYTKTFSEYTYFTQMLT
jgi:hypothetical protein